MFFDLPETLFRGSNTIFVFSKVGFINPVANNTQRDPSTAWRTKFGEWRFTTFDTQIFGSMDFKSWYRLGSQKGFPAGECPSFFPLPNATPGAGTAPVGASAPTHVHKVPVLGDIHFGSHLMLSRSSVKIRLTYFTCCTNFLRYGK